jgi:hypothetical protein
MDPESDANERAQNALFGKSKGKDKINRNTLFAAVIGFVALLLICYFAHTYTTPKVSFMNPVDMVIPPLTPEYQSPFYDDNPDKRYNVTYNYTEQQDNIIKTDPGENVLFSSAHANVMEDYPVYK